MLNQLIIHIISFNLKIFIKNFFFFFYQRRELLKSKYFMAWRGDSKKGKDKIDLKQRLQQSNELYATKLYAIYKI